MDPAGGSVDGSGVAGRLDESLDEHGRCVVALGPVCCSPRSVDADRRGKVLIRSDSGGSNDDAKQQRAPDRRNLLRPEGSPGSHRILAAPLQRHPPTQQPGIPGAGAGNDRSAKLAARLRYAPPTIQLGRKTVNALTFKLDQSVGADQQVIATNVR